MNRSPASAGARTLRWGLAVVAVLLSLEALGYGLVLATHWLWDDPIRTRAAVLAEQSARIRRLLDSDQTGREIIDSTLGWRYRPGFTSEVDHVSRQGLRGRRVYPPVPGDSMLRVAAFGDSFVYGNEVPDDSGWSAQLERTHSDIEVLNYGVGGYGVDQAFLRFLEEGDALQPHLVIVGFVADDITRVVNVFRRFRSSEEWPLSKPRFVLTDGLQLVPNPLKDSRAYEALLAVPSSVRLLGQLDHWYDPHLYQGRLYQVSAMARFVISTAERIRRRYFDGDRILVGEVLNTQSEAFRIQVVLFEAFCEEVTRRGMQPLIVFFPDATSIARRLRGESTVYAPLVQAVSERGLPYTDLADSFLSALGSTWRERLFMPGGHYTGEGNGIVAEALGMFLDGPTRPVNMSHMEVRKRG